MSDRLHVLVIGGGLGGLSLTQGLRGAGVDVTVYERESAPGKPLGGHRIQVNPAGNRALRAGLPEPLWRAFLSAAGPGGEFGFLTEQLNELVVVEESVMYPLAPGNRRLENQLRPPACKHAASSSRSAVSSTACSTTTEPSRSTSAYSFATARITVSRPSQPSSGRRGQVRRR